MMSAYKNGAIFGGFSRLNKFPLDYTSIFPDISALERYLTEDPELNPSPAYGGQIVSVLSDGSVYYIIKTKNPNENIDIKTCYKKILSKDEQTEILTLIQELETSLRNTDNILNGKIDADKAELQESISIIINNMSTLANRVTIVEGRATNLENNLATFNWVQDIKTNLIALSNDITNIVKRPDIANFITIEDVEARLVELITSNDLTLEDYLKKEDFNLMTTNTISEEHREMVPNSGAVIDYVGTFTNALRSRLNGTL